MKPESLTSEQQKIVNFLMEKGIIGGPEPLPEPAKENRNLAPSKLTLFPTNQCQLACGYCYATSSRPSPLTMDWDTVTSAVDYHIGNLVENGKGLFILELHGGGEPLYAWQLARQMVDYAREECRKHDFILEVVAGTNGILGEKQLEWVADNFASLNISFDGLPHVQNFQRPLTGGGPSFPYLDRTLKYFDSCGFPYGIRCTVTSYNENLLEETIDFITAHYQTRLVYLEPAYICGKPICPELLAPPDLGKFAENFKRLARRYQASGIRLEYSGARLERISGNFCYVGTDDFAVTPDGYLTNCWEVGSGEHPLAGTFIFGKITPGGGIEVDGGKLAFLRSLSVDHIEYCRDCFAKWHCGGDCATRLGHGNYHGPRGGPRCETNRMLIKDRIIRMLEEEDRYQR